MFSPVMVDHVRRATQDPAPPPWTDTPREEPTHPCVRHVFVDGAFGVPGVTHHAVEFFWREGDHYVVQWEVGAENLPITTLAAALTSPATLAEVFRLGTIQTLPWAGFVSQQGGKPLFVRRYEAGMASLEEARERIAPYLGEHDAALFVGEDYHVATNNCEHLSTFIMTGSRYSEQLERARVLVRNTDELRATLGRAGARLVEAGAPLKMAGAKLVGTGARLLQLAAQASDYVVDYEELTHIAEDVSVPPELHAPRTAPAAPRGGGAATRAPTKEEQPFLSLAPRIRARNAPQQAAAPAQRRRTRVPTLRSMFSQPRAVLVGSRDEHEPLTNE